MDLYDRATELETLQREHAIAAQRARAPHGESASECERCGEEIPDARRQAVPGCTRCTECESLRERGR
ncbi:MAG: TraR/DksA family transcriptional regulator [Burkholderiales bacterium]|nr:TraR/DksA family transcriptional regulator [Burkholderiales bacterium]